MSKIILRLYVIGKTRLSANATKNLKNILEKNFTDRYELEIIDLSENPELAEKDKILAVPAVVRKLPPPIQKIVGDLSDEEKVLVGLDLVPEKNSRRKTGQ